MWWNLFLLSNYSESVLNGHPRVQASVGGIKVWQLLRKGVQMELVGMERSHYAEVFNIST